MFAGQASSLQQIIENHQLHAQKSASHPISLFAEKRRVPQDFWKPLKDVCQDLRWICRWKHFLFELVIRRFQLWMILLMESWCHHCFREIQNMWNIKIRGPGTETRFTFARRIHFGKFARLHVYFAMLRDFDWAISRDHGAKHSS